MKLDAQEKHAVLAAIKSIFSVTPEKENSKRIFYVDMLMRIEADYFDKNTTVFLGQLADKILERTEKLVLSPSITEEAGVRASVVKEMYARIKEKVTNEQSK